MTVFRRALSPYPQYKGFNVYSSWPLGRYERDAAYLRVEYDKYAKVVKASGAKVD